MKEANKGPSQNTVEEEKGKLLILENGKFKKTMRYTFKYVMSCPGKGEMNFTFIIQNFCLSNSLSTCKFPLFYPKYPLDLDCPNLSLLQAQMLNKVVTPLSFLLM